VLTHGEDGLLFEPGSSAALVAALSDLVGDESQRRRLGAAARQTILDKDLTWQGIARRIIRVVESL
jgi:glycosyltransferase involved in cell wall biosynthesis